jgi:altronate dehydratase large subunit
MLGADIDQFRRTLLGFSSHPNVGGVLVVGLGCELLQAAELAAAVSTTGRPAASLVIQECGGETKAVRLGAEIAGDLMRQVRSSHRERIPVSELVLATECGASDYSSGISSNPVIGWVADRIVELGGTVVLSETTEMIGAEHMLAGRSVSPDVATRILDLVGSAEKAAIRMGVDIRGSQPTPGNIRGGLTTIEEKSLGCIQKGGRSKIQGVVDYACTPKGSGLWVMDTPGQDVESVTGMVAGGAQIVLFSTGLGTPVGCPIAPVLKITGNQDTAIRMAEHIDFNVAPILRGAMSVEDGGTQLLRVVLDCANGRLTKAEKLGHGEFGIHRIGPTL